MHGRAAHGGAARREGRAHARATGGTHPRLGPRPHGGTRPRLGTQHVSSLAGSINALRARMFRSRDDLSAHRIAGAFVSPSRRTYIVAPTYCGWRILVAPTLCGWHRIYICEDKDLEAGSCTRVSGAPPAELEILAPVDEIEVPRVRGAPDPRHCRRNRRSEVSRSSRSSKLSEALRRSRSGTQRGHASEMGGFSLETVDDIEVRRLRGAPCHKKVDEIEARKLRGAPGRALNADTRTRWRASAPHRASSIYIYICIVRPAAVYTNRVP
ncbi:hypothetical protein N9L68_01650 [bacterium]|nr:hypothetical protein [bacterium]